MKKLKTVIPYILATIFVGVWVVIAWNHYVLVKAESSYYKSRTLEIVVDFCGKMPDENFKDCTGLELFGETGSLINKLLNQAGNE